MARPYKDGVDYFPLDVGFLRDKKVRLIKGEFGARGIMILLSALCRVYEDNGYYTTLDEDDKILMADEIGCGVTAELVGQVVQGCVKRSMFSDTLLNAFGVLTSPGIQRRFLRMVAGRDEIEIIKDYWLLDMSDKRDVPVSILNKITFKNVSGQINPVKRQINPVKSTDNPQSKPKEIERESKALSARAALGERFERFWDAYPKKMERGTAESAFLRISPDEDLLREMLRSIDKAKRSAQWTDKGGRFIPYPAKWLKCDGWKNVVNESEGKASYNGYEQRDYSSEELEAAAGTQALLDEARAKD